MYCATTQADSKSEADAKKATLVALQAADAQLNAAKSASSAQSNSSSSSNAAAQHAAAAAANAAIAAAAASDTNSSSSSSSGSSKSSTAAAADAAVAAAAEAVSSASSSSSSSTSRGPSEAALNVVEAAAAKLEAVKGHEALQLRAAEEAAAAKRRASDEEVDKSVQRVQNKLASMLDKLELDIQVYCMLLLLQLLSLATSPASCGPQSLYSNILLHTLLVVDADRFSLRA
jgi:hypothetical protein